MFFYASKLLWLVFEPSAFITLLLSLGVGLWLTRRAALQKLASRLIVWGTLLLLVVGLSPLGNAMTVFLEERFKRPDLSAPGTRIDGIVILGGVLSPEMSQLRGEFSLNDSAERLTEALILARRFPEAKVVFTGGSGRLMPNEPDEAGSAGQFLRALGLAPERIILEDRSRNTYENAVFARKAVTPKPGEHWLLVTSAFHMPRSMGCFRKAGFAVEPWPVDYHTAGPADAALFNSSIADGLKRFDIVAKEFIGLIAYRIRGRTDALVPAPQPRGLVAAMPVR